MSTTPVYYTQLDSPVGPVLLTSNGTALTGLYMTEHKYGEEIGDNWVPSDDAAPFPDAKRQIEAYFAGTLTHFDLPLAMSGTPFQRRVWEALLAIPYGETTSYGELARSLGNPGASRAVGLANGRNPISIIVPCHRVIGSNGKLTGYGGGLPRKSALLALEASTRASQPHAYPPVDNETATPGNSPRLLQQALFG
jgi:methylated-DNA-[protein]-cysteine S-methyltransferase